MAYARFNFRTKRELIAAVKAGVGVKAWQPGDFPLQVRDGQVALEGPWFPQAHTWYATAWVEPDGTITKVK